MAIKCTAVELGAWRRQRDRNTGRQTDRHTNVSQRCLTPPYRMEREYNNAITDIAPSMHFCTQNQPTTADSSRNRQHMQTPYQGQIWHVTVGQLSTLTGLISSGSVYTVAPMQGKNAKMLQLRPNFHICGGSCAYFLDRCGPNLARDSRPAAGLRLHAKFHLNQFIVLHSRDEKPQFWTMLTFGGSDTQPLYRRWRKIFSFGGSSTPMPAPLG